MNEWMDEQSSGKNHCGDCQKLLPTTPPCSCDSSPWISAPVVTCFNAKTVEGVEICQSGPRLSEPGNLYFYPLEISSAHTHTHTNQMSLLNGEHERIERGMWEKMAASQPRARQDSCRWRGARIQPQMSSHVLYCRQEGATFPTEPCPDGVMNHKTVAGVTQ
jgi:hypothetical protein